MDTHFAVTDSAARRIAEILADQPQAASLRVAVLAGGCSGFQYKFELDHEQQPDDVLIERDGARVVVDPTSLDLLATAQLDYVESLMGSYFAVKNPIATSSCGCGSSFAID